MDALRTLAFALAESNTERPDVVAFFGDQVCVDETTEAVREFIGARRDIRDGWNTSWT